MIRRITYLFKSHQYFVGPPLLILKSSLGVEYQAFSISLFKSEILEIAFPTDFRWDLGQEIGLLKETYLFHLHGSNQLLFVLYASDHYLAEK